MLRVDAWLCVMPLPLLYSVSQFNIHLLLQVFTAISDELRAKSNAEYASKGKHRYAQLDFVTSLPHISWTKPHTRCLTLATHSILPLLHTHTLTTDLLHAMLLCAADSSAGRRTSTSFGTPGGAAVARHSERTPH
jgi:hypothetical protein